MKKTLSILLCAVMMIAFGAVVGCTPPEKDTTFRVNLLNDANWKDANKESTDDNENAGKTVYEFSKTGENKFNPVKVTKLTEWDALKLNLADKDLKSVKKLVITLKADKDTECIVKLLSSPSMEANQEIKFGISSTEKTYEFDLSFEGYAPVRAGLASLEIIAAPGNGTFTGDITISKLEFNDEAPIKDNVLNEENKDLILPYDGVSATYSVMGGWKENDKDTYTIVKNANGSLSITVHALATTDYKFARTKAQGNLKGFTKFVVTLKGKSGTKILFKFEGGGTTMKEHWIDFTGDVQTVEIALEEKNLPEVSSDILFFASPTENLAEDYVIEVSKMEFAK